LARVGTADDGGFAMKSAVLGFWLATLTTAAVGYGAWWTYQRMRADAHQYHDFGGRSKPAASLLSGRKPHFSLTERNGQSFNTKELDGKVWVVSFFYSSCPGPCFRQNQALSQLQKELRDRDIRFVSITCDPTVDTPDKLKEYAGRFNADPVQWLFLTGQLEAIQDIAQKQFLLPLQQQTHSERAVVIDGRGEIRDVFDTLDADEMKKMKRLLIELDDEAAQAAEKSS
jgi:cytochrome oxidase Cu insertion factor (SCO1/SenC/PrrC family)